LVQPLQLVEVLFWEERLSMVEIQEGLLVKVETLLLEVLLVPI